MDSPLLLYIDVWHPNFLPPNLSVSLCKTNQQTSPPEIVPFLPNARSAGQQQGPQGRSPTPPPPPPLRHSQKRQRTAEQPPAVSRVVPSRTPPRASGGIIIREPPHDAQPTAQVGSHAVSFSQQEVGWQTIFRLGSEPLLVTASVRT